MWRYLGRRLLISLPVLLGITFFAFLFINLAPGDPVMVLISPEQASRLGHEWLEEQRARLGLNRPFLVRYAIWVAEVARGNFGYSYRTQQPVIEMLAARLGPTVELMGTAQGLAVLLGVPLGMLAALHQYSWVDYVSAVLGFLVVCIPSFFLGLGLIYVLSINLGLFPTGGIADYGISSSLGNHLWHLVLPAFVLGMAQTAPLLRHARGSMLEVIRQDYIMTAHAKGLAALRVNARHALPNAAIPLITVVALNIPLLVGGAVVTEQVFRWPGMGQLALDSIQGRDYPALMGINLLTAVLVLAGNLIADLLYAFIDPRIRYG
ncbi:MAG: ABC transporter permease [Armatimonadota bacterium]